MTALDVAPMELGRVRLVPLERAHVADLTAAATAERSTFDLAPIPRDRGEMERYVDAALAERNAGRQLPFTVLNDGAIVGMYRLMSLEWWTWREGPIHVAGEPRVAPKDPPDVAEIGHVWLATSVQKSLVHPSALMLLMTHAFDVWRVHRLVWKTDARNMRSRQAILKFGGTFEGIMRQHTPAADGIIRDVALFSILPAEWPRVREEVGKALRNAA